MDQGQAASSSSNVASFSDDMAHASGTQSSSSAVAAHGAGGGGGGGGSKNIAEDAKEFFQEYGEANRYSIREVVGKGSYGVVCSAVDNFTGVRWCKRCEVASKV